jgi:3-hydroxyisobutyrate dehydrogenase
MTQLDTPIQASFIGLGAMGGPMAATLARSGHLAGAWNRSSGRAEAWGRTHGTRVFATLAEVACAAPVVFLCVSRDADVLELVGSLLPHLVPGQIVIDCSTTAPQTARTAALRLRSAGVAFLDCPVSGGTEGAAAGTLTLFVGGDPATVERVRPLLASLGSRITHLGPTGQGQAAKAVNQLMLAGINQAVSEALAFAVAEKLPLPELIDALSHGAAASWFLAHRGPRMAERHYPLGFKMALHAKDLRICRDMAAQHGVQLPLAEMTLHHYDRLPGCAEQDLAALFELKRALFEKKSTG